MKNSFNGEYVYPITNMQLHSFASKMIGRGLTDDEYGKVKTILTNYLDGCLDICLKDIVMKSIDS